MKCGVQGQFGARQDQRKRVVIGAQFMTATRAHAQAAAVSGDQPQAVPAHRIDMGLGQRNQAGGGQLEQFGRQPPSRLAEGLCADSAGAPAAASRCAK
jgi:hypothetical protein